VVFGIASGSVWFCPPLTPKPRHVTLALLCHVPLLGYWGSEHRHGKRVFEHPGHVWVYNANVSAVMKMHALCNCSTFAYCVLGSSGS
jgi:hypothetical protein